MEEHIFLNGTLAALLLLFTFRKWVLKGDVFHPGFVYCLINCGFFIVFAFGPYSYSFNLDFSYYYMYVLISFTFVVGIIYGNVTGDKKIVKDIKISYLQLWIIYGILLAVLSSRLSGLFSGGGAILENGVENRTKILEQIAQGSAKLNVATFIMTIVETSYIRLSSIIVVAYSIAQRQRYWWIALLIVMLTLSSILTNSRSNLLIGLAPILVTIYSLLKDRGIINFAQIKWSKNFKFTVPITIAVIFVIGALTNARSSIVAAEYEAPYEYVESTTNLQRKEWFNKFIKSQSVTIVNPIAELSIYAGSTVVHGGLISKIAVDSGLRTWGLRNFFAIHRILSLLKLDWGISDLSVQNYQRIVARAQSSLASIEYSWWGFPGNLIVDFGYIGSPVASFITGWIIGWVYGRVSYSGSIIKATGYSIVLISVILSPAFGPFSEFTGFITSVLIVFYLLGNAIKIKYLQY